MMKIASLFLALLMILSLAACGADPAEPADTAESAETTPAETTPAETTADPLDDNLPELTYNGEDIRIWVDGQYDYYELTEDEFIEGDAIHEAVVSRNETVEQACMVHGVDPESLLAKVNEMIAAEK